MIELVRHIEVLLLSNDCVIVPDFGGFMAHHVDARYDATDGSFIPPLRTLGFNPQLRINDSLLIHSYIEAYNISYPEAMRRVTEESNALQQQLRQDGFFELNNIGTLSLNVDGNIEFTPNEAGILTPDYYGLASFEMQKLMPETIEQLPLPSVNVAQEVKRPEKEEPKPVLAIDESNDDDGDTINIRIAWIRNAVAIAAAILAFFLVTTPISNSVDSQMAQVSITPIPSTLNPQPAAQPSVPVATNQAEPSEASDAQPQSPYYVVVLASQVSLANAETFVQILNEQGFDDARIYTHNKVNRVVCGHCDTEADAYQLASQIRQNKEYDQAWVLEIKQ